MLADSLAAAPPDDSPSRYDSGSLDLIRVRHTFIETVDASGTLDAEPGPPPGLTLERAVTWPRGSAPPGLAEREDAAEDGAAKDDASEAGSDDSEERDTVPPLSAENQFPNTYNSMSTPEDVPGGLAAALLGPSSPPDLAPNPLELSRVETPDEHFFPRYRPGEPAFVRANNRQTAADAHSGGFQQGVPAPVGLGGGWNSYVQVQAVSVGPPVHPEEASRCDPVPAPPPESPQGIAGESGPRCIPPAPANAPRLDAAATPAIAPAASVGGASSSADSRRRSAADGRPDEPRANAAQAPNGVGLHLEPSSASSNQRVWWNVRASTLESNDKDVVSQQFALNVGDEGPVNFKLGLYPKVSSDARGGASFRRAKGKGRVTLMCIDSVRTHTVLKFLIAVGPKAARPEDEGFASPRGPVTHDFFERKFASLPTGSDEWDFRKAKDPSTESFTVCLQILPASD